MVWPGCCAVVLACGSPVPSYESLPCLLSSLCQFIQQVEEMFLTLPAHLIKPIDNQGQRPARHYHNHGINPNPGENGPRPYILLIVFPTLRSFKGR
jgi:hypothetical protein